MAAVYLGSGGCYHRAARLYVADPSRPVQSIRGSPVSPGKRLLRTGETRSKGKGGTRSLAGESLEAEPILDFFETVGLLLRRRALDTEMVAHTFSYWIENYYAALKSHISLRQKRDPLVWQDLKELAKIVHRSREKRLGRSLPEISPEDSVHFLEEELTEA